MSNEVSDKSGRRGEEEEEDGLLGYTLPQHLESQSEQQANTRRWVVPVIIAAITILSSVIGTIAAFTYEHHHGLLRHQQPITLDKLFDGTFAATKHDIKWVSPPNSTNGVYGVQDENGSISLVDLTKNTTKMLVDAGEVLDIDGEPLEYDGWSLSSDAKFILFRTDTLKVFRYSNFANYYLHSLETHKTHPLANPTDPASISLAKWAPSGHAIVYVKSNDLYVVHARDVPKETSKAVRITDSGTETIFNGVTDWVYEEEVFNSHDGTWWNSASEMIAYLTLDESKVREYKIPVYNPTDSSENISQYPEELRIKYPQPGTPNPLVTLTVYSLINGQKYELAFPAIREDRLIIEVAWTSKKTLLVKETSRDSRSGSVVLFDFNNVRDAAYVQGITVRDLSTNDGGWIDCKQTITPIDSISGDGYLDIVPNEGYNHIAFYKSSSEASPEFATSGEWEIGDILATNDHQSRVYFVAAYPTPIDRHILSVSLPTNDTINVLEKETPANLTDTSLGAKYSAAFNKQGSFYVLNYDGPHVPTQQIREVRNESHVHTVELNEGLNATLKEYALPQIIYDTVILDDIEIQVKEVRPAQFKEDSNTKHPVLFQIYGGPDSQAVSQQYSKQWSDYLATVNEYVVVFADVRGSGMRGRAHRNVVTNNLGETEASDLVALAEHYAQKSYVDATRIGVWGWSYGGYLTAKTMEAGSDVFNLAASVAPVTDWRLYDSVYTERYMSTPDRNKEGYDNAAVRNVTGFHNYALAHGTGDDNVHFANTAHLLDMLTQNSVRDFEFRAFTDSTHSINTRGAYRELFDWLTRFLNEKWTRQKKQGKKGSS